MFRKSIKSSTRLILWTVILSFLVCSIVCPGCAPLVSTLDPNDKTFHVDVPTGWKVEPNQEFALYAINPIEGPSDNYHEIMMVGVEVLPVNVSLKRYMAALRKEIEGDFLDARIIEEGPAYLSKKAGRYIIFEFMEEKHIIKAVVYTVMGNSRGYNLFFLSSRGEFDRHYMLFDKLKDTFRIEKKW